MSSRGAPRLSGLIHDGLPSGITEFDIREAADFLEKKCAFIKLQKIKDETIVYILDEARLYLGRGLFFENKYEEIGAEEANKKMKAERDDEIQTFQHQDLAFRVTKMNDEQLKSWEDQKRLNTRILWIGIASLLISFAAAIISLVKYQILTVLRGRYHP
jgi:hypothetical protein